MQILNVGLAFDAISWIAGYLLAARAEFEVAFRYSVTLSPSFFVLAFVGAALGGAPGCAVGVAAFYTLVTPYYSWLVFRRVGVDLRGLVSFYVYPSLTAPATMGVAALGSKFVDGDLLHCVVIETVGPGLNILALSLIYPALLREGRDWLLRKIQRTHLT